MQQTEAANKPKVATVTSEMSTPEVVAQHMATDKQNLEGLSEEQAQRIMMSMFSLFNNLAS